MCQSEINLINNDNNNDYHYNSSSIESLSNHNNNNNNTGTNICPINGVAAKIHRIKNRQSQFMNNKQQSSINIDNDMVNVPIRNGKFIWKFVNCKIFICKIFFLFTNFNIVRY